MARVGDKSHQKPNVRVFMFTSRVLGVNNIQMIQMIAGYLPKWLPG